MTEPAPIRLLLDEGFPTFPNGGRIDFLDRSVHYETLAAAAPDFVNKSTPDWLVYLIAKDLGFTALVTSDHSQLEQDEELIALNLSRMSVITWASRQDDAIVMWGQLLSYMPQIIPALQPGAVVMLPGARLRPKDHLLTASGIAHQRKLADGVSFSERRGEALKVMRKELSTRSADHLLKHLGADDGRSTNE